MASLNGFASSITGTTGSVNFLEPKSGWRIFIAPRGVHVKTAGSASPIVTDSTDASSRILSNQWFQIGTDVTKVRRCSTSGGTWINYSGSNMSVTSGDRVVVIGNTQPTVSGTSATYQPHTTLYSNDDDASTKLTNSMLTSDSNGGWQYWTVDGIYDAIVQDNNQACQYILEDIVVGNAPGDLIPDTPYTRLVGNTTFPWDSVYYAGELISGVTGAAGRTYHSFDTVAGWTQGNLFGFALNNVTKVYGDTHGGVFHSWTLPEVYNVKSAKFGAKGDGTTDDTTAVQAAITECYAAGAGGGIVFFPKGTYIVNSTITIAGSRVRLVGVDRRSSIIKAGASFTFNGTTDAVIRIGEGLTATYSRIENIGIDCNAIAGSIGIYSQAVRESSGLRDCNILNYVVKGIFISGTNAGNWRLSDLEIFHATNASTAIGIDTLNAGDQLQIDNVTINSYSGSYDATSGTGMRFQGGITRVRKVHIEGMHTGIHYSTDATGSVSDVKSSGTGVNRLVRIDQAGVRADNISPNGASFTIWDTIQGHSSVMQGGGWYHLSNDTGVGLGSSRTFHSSDPLIADRIYKPVVFGTTVQIAGTAVDSVITTLTAGTVITVPAGNMFGISTSPAGTTTVTSFANVTSGRRIKFLGQAGTLTINSGNNIWTPGGTNKTLNVKDVAEFECVGTTWILLSNPTAVS